MIKMFTANGERGGIGEERWRERGEEEGRDVGEKRERGERICICVAVSR